MVVLRWKANSTAINSQNAKITSRMSYTKKMYFSKHTKAKALVTKSIPKNREFDCRQIAQRLEGLVNTVAKRPVFVVAKNSEVGYDLLNYVTKKPMITGIATKFLAKTLCEYCNCTNHTAQYFQKAQKVFDRYLKLFNDTTVYSHIAHNSNDSTQAGIARMRLAHTRQQMEQLVRSIKLPV